MATTVSPKDKPYMQGWELGALFLVFLFITLSWEVLVGVLTFLNNILRGRKASWLSRVKEELLALGVVSLVLLFVEVRAARRLGGGPCRA